MTEPLTLETLAAHLAAVEDELAVIRLIASYGPMVDTGWPEEAPGLFAPDGVYDVNGGQLQGREAIARMLAGEQHQTCVKTGIVHAMGLPWVRIEGDRAVATNTTQLFQHGGDGYTIFRVAQNVWHLQRGAEGWQITHRTNRLIGPDGEAVELLREAVRGE